MNIFDGTLRVATEEDCKRRWSGSEPGLRFRCGLCGHKFEPGDKWRGVMANVAGSPARMGNFLACESCNDAYEGKDKYLLIWRCAMEAEAARRFWWLIESDSVLRHLDKGLDQ